MADKHELRVKDRLCSIYKDTQFVKDFQETFYPNFPLIPNRRSGCWYVPNYKESVYFKSTDGHYGKWDFNLGRLNLHIVPVILDAKGVIIVDITRKGKRYPDSLSKTIPIWCCVLNRARNQLFPKETELDEELRVLPSAVSGNESSQIEELLNDMVERFIRNAGDALNQLKELNKPLRPLWACPTSVLISDGWKVDIDELEYYPVVCLSASMVNHEAETWQVLPPLSAKSGSISFEYVQGAADDAENWAFNCSAEDIWQNMDSLLQMASDTEREEWMRLVAGQLSVSAKVDSISALGETGLFLGSWHACKLEVYACFDLVINCTEEIPAFITEERKEITPECFIAGKYIQLLIPEGKRGQKKLRSCIPVALDAYSSAYRRLSMKPKVLVHCRQGKDRSVGIVLALLVAYFPRCDGEICIDAWNPTSTLIEYPKYEKESFRKALIFVMSHRPVAAPTRATMKQLNSVFIS